MLIGTNADPHHGFLPSEIVKSGVWLVRFPLWRGFDYGPFIDGLLDAEIRPVPVLDRRSFTEYEWQTRSYLSRLRWWRSRLPTLQYIQAGNEPDGTGGPSSAQSRVDYFRLVRNARTVWPGATILGAGLSQIDFTYYGSSADIECFHPYAQDSETVVSLVDEIRRHTDKQLWATEFGVPRAFYPTEHDRAVWHTEMLIALWKLNVAGAIQFPYGQVMEDSFDGMVNAPGAPTEVWAAISSAIDPLQGPPPAGFVPAIEDVPGNVAGAFTSQPLGIILHSTRSGQNYSEAQEYRGTVNYVQSGAGGLGWHCTVGPGTLAIHMAPHQWGWNARSHSQNYLAIEHAQARLGDPVSDAVLDTSAYWIREYALKRWPNLPLNLVHHSELPAGIADGKTDMAMRGSGEAADLRQRILSRL